MAKPVPTSVLLASRSPQRKALLEALGLKLTVVASGVEEQTDGDPREVVLENVRVPGRCLLGGKEKLDARLARAREGARSGQSNASMATFERTRPAVGAQAILSFDPAIQEPRDLAGVPVGINDRTGSHYTTLQSLEGVLAREDIVVEHLGIPENRYQALKDGRSRAVAVMEPFISLGLKEGAHLVDVTFYRGAEVIAPGLSTEQRSAYLGAINEAADRIMADFGRYKHYVTEQTRGRLAPHEMSEHFVRYTHYVVYDEKRFEQVYEWMRSWGLASGKGDHASVVATF